DLFARGLVPPLLLHQDRDGDVVRVLAEDFAQFPAREEIVLAFAQVQRHVGAARSLLDRLYRVLPFARALPAHTLIRRQAGAPRRQRDAVGNDERGVEADAELADELRLLRTVGF